MSGVKLTRDSSGEEVCAGDLVRFAYGVPPRGVEARVIERNGHLVALTPNDTPRECRLDKLEQLVGGFYKTMPRSEDPGEVEANVFRARRSGLQALGGSNAPSE